jgi:redox-sensitive bicupin YhaK (pirin superfamily)
MTTVFFPHSERHFINQGWLQSYFSFSFADWYDPEKLGFGKLKVLNDDIVAPASGFDFHSHSNMEIVTLVTCGQLEHKDTMGNQVIVGPGEVQTMTAGTGLLHSENNPSPDKLLKLLQVWIHPKEMNLKPRYNHHKFTSEGRDNQWQVIASGMGEGEALPIHQDAAVKLSCFEGGQVVEYDFSYQGNGLYLFVIKGTVHIGDYRLRTRDALAISELGSESLPIEILEDAQLLAIEVPI